MNEIKVSEENFAVLFYSAITGEQTGSLDAVSLEEAKKYLEKKQFGLKFPLVTHAIIFNNNGECVVPLEVRAKNNCYAVVWHSPSGVNNIVTDSYVSDLDAIREARIRNSERDKELNTLGYAVIDDTGILIWVDTSQRIT